MQKAQDDLKATVDETIKWAKGEVQAYTEEVKATKPVDAGVAFGVALFLSLALQVATRQREDPYLTFGVFFYALLAGASAILLKKKVPREQFIFLVVLFSLFRLIIDIAALPVLILSATPAIVTLATDEVKKHIKTQ